jgi:hypothetical protein
MNITLTSTNQSCLQSQTARIRTSGLPSAQFGENMVMMFFLYGRWMFWLCKLVGCGDYQISKASGPLCPQHCRLWWFWISRFIHLSLISPNTARPLSRLLLMVSRDYAPKYASAQYPSRSRLDPDLRSNYSFTTARNQLSNCLERCENCSSKKESLLPTSVTEVSSENLPWSVLWKGTQGEYAAFTRYWGGDVFLVLTSKIIG